MPNGDNNTSVDPLVEALGLKRGVTPAATPAPKQSANKSTSNVDPIVDALNLKKKEPTSDGGKSSPDQNTTPTKLPVDNSGPAAPIYKTTADLKNEFSSYLQQNAQYLNKGAEGKVNPNAIGALYSDAQNGNPYAIKKVEDFIQDGISKRTVGGIAPTGEDFKNLESRGALITPDKAGQEQVKLDAIKPTVPTTDDLTKKYVLSSLVDKHKKTGQPLDASSIGEEYEKIFPIQDKETTAKEQDVINGPGIKNTGGIYGLLSPYSQLTYVHDTDADIVKQNVGYRQESVGLDAMYNYQNAEYDDLKKQYDKAPTPELKAKLDDKATEIQTTSDNYKNLYNKYPQVAQQYFERFIKDDIANYQSTDLPLIGKFVVGPHFYTSEDDVNKAIKRQIEKDPNFSTQFAKQIADLKGSDLGLFDNELGGTNVFNDAFRRGTLGAARDIEDFSMTTEERTARDLSDRYKTSELPTSFAAKYSPRIILSQDGKTFVPAKNDLSTTFNNAINFYGQAAPGILEFAGLEGLGSALDIGGNVIKLGQSATGVAEVGTDVTKLGEAGTKFAENVNKSAGLLGAQYAMSYNKNYDEAYYRLNPKNAKELNDVKSMAHLYTLTEALAFKAMGLSPNELVQGTLRKSVGEDIYKFLTEEDLSKITNEELSKKMYSTWKDKIPAIIKASGVEGAKFGGINVIQQAFKDGINKAFVPDSRTAGIDQYTDAFESGAALGSVFGLLGNLANYKDISPATGDVIYKLGSKSDAYHSIIDKGVEDGTITQERANDLKKIVNTAAKSIGDIKNKTYDDGTPLKDEDKIKLTKNNFKDAFLSNLSKEENADKERIKTEQDNTKKASADILANSPNLPVEVNVNPETFKVETIKPIGDTEIQSTFESIKSKIPESELETTQSVVEKVNNAQLINEKELEKGQDGLYSALEAHPEAAHLIEPLILKLQNYPDELKTKTETRTVTEDKPIEGAYATKSRPEVRAPLEQSDGKPATITTPEGKVTTGILKIQDGKYYLMNDKGEKVSVIGEKKITDSRLSISEDENPVLLDKNGNVKSFTLKTENGNSITINDPETALNIAIQHFATGTIPNAAFEKAYTTEEKQIQEEVPVKDISSQSKTTNNGSKKEGSQESGKNAEEDNAQESSDGKKGDVGDTSNPSDKGAVSNLETVPIIASPAIETADKNVSRAAVSEGNIESESGEIPPTITEEEANNDSSSPVQISLQRKALSKQVQEAFFKPKDRSKSVPDDVVLDNAVNTLAREAEANKMSIDDHLNDKVNDWYDSIFNDKGERKTDANGSKAQKVLTNEEQAMLGIYSLKLAQKIRDLKINSGSVIDAAQLENLEGDQLRMQNLTGVVGESAGSSLRYLSQIYKFGNDGSFEVFRKTASSMMGADVPLDKDEFDKFKEGLSPNQKKAADILHNALLKAKDITDKTRDRILGSDELYKKAVSDEVQKQIKSEVDKAVKAAIKEFATENKASGGKVTDSKGRIIKSKANDIANKLNDFADKLGGKGLVMSSPLGIIQQTARLVLKGIAEGIRQGGKIPELIERGIAKYKEMDEFKDVDHDEVLKMVKSGLAEAGIDKETIGAKTTKDSILNDIHNMAKNQNTNSITKEMVTNGYIKNLALDLAENGTPVDKVTSEVADLLKANGIETDVADINEAYLQRGKYALGKLSDIQKGEKAVGKEITEHAKLQADINDLDRKIKEVNENGQLSLQQKDSKSRELNKQREAKFDEFEKTLREKGIKLERGSKESKEAKTAVIDAYNYSTSELGKRISLMLDNGQFDNMSEANKNFIRSIEKKLSHTINAHDLNSQMDVIKGKINTVLGDLFKDHGKKDKPEDVSARADKGLSYLQSELKDISRELSSNRQKSAEDIKLSEYKKRLINQKNDFERRKAAGEFDDTKIDIDKHKDSEALQLETEMRQAKYDFYREAKRAQEAQSSKFVKFLRGTRELSRNMLLSGISLIQGKVILSAVTRAFQFPSKLQSSLMAHAIGIENARTNFDPKSFWRGVSETIKSKSSSQISDILQKSGDELDKASVELNKSQNQYKDIVVKNGGDENSKEAVQFKTNELSLAQAKYDAANLANAANNIYNHINPIDKGGRWSILKDGVTKEEAELGMLGKKESLRDYLHEPYDANLDNEDRVKDMDKRMNSMPDKIRRSAKALVFASKAFIRFHGVYKDIPARQAMVEGYLKRLQAEQNNPNGMDISDPRVQNKLWTDAVAWDGQEAKFQDHNKAADWVRSSLQQKPVDFVSGSNKNMKEALGVITSMATPVLKIPLNIYNTALHYNFGALYGMFKATDIMMKARGEDLSFKDYMNTKMTEEQRHKFVTIASRGTIGAVMMAGAAIMMKNGNLVMGGQFPDPKKKIMVDGKMTELQYGDMVVDGKLLPHWISLAVAHLPNFYPAVTGYYAMEDYERNKAESKGADVLDDLYRTSQRMVAEIPDIPLERGRNEYGDQTLDFKNPYSYLGYFGAVKDVERAVGAGQDKAKQYELSPAQQIYDNAGLLFLVPSEKEEQDQKRASKMPNLKDAEAIRKEYPFLVKHK